ARAAFEAARAGGGAIGWAGGTIGAVARDAAGRTAAATSTGGMINKRAGRVGDSPIVGAGTYADDAAGAVSATGHGEGILRLSLGSRAAARTRRGPRAEEAARASVAALSERLGVTSGIIAIDREGRWGLA